MPEKLYAQKQKTPLLHDNGEVTMSLPVQSMYIYMYMYICFYQLLSVHMDTAYIHVHVHVHVFVKIVKHMKQMHTNFEKSS